MLCASLGGFGILALYLQDRFGWRAPFALFAAAGWLLSLPLRNVSIVDSLWSLMFLLAATVYLTGQAEPGPRAWLVTTLVALWAIRLAAYITWRNWGEAEDRRYVDIRARNQPDYERKSLYLVFEMQALLAWIVSMALLAAVSGGSAQVAASAAGASTAARAAASTASSIAGTPLVRTKLIDSTEPSARIATVTTGLVCGCFTASRTISKVLLLKMPSRSSRSSTRPSSRRTWHCSRSTR